LEQPVSRDITLVAEVIGMANSSYHRRKAQLCAALARSDGADPLDAYVLALAHNAAWNVMLRAMDTVGGNTPWRLGTALVAALAQRRDQLLAIIATQWHLPDGTARLAADVGRHGLTADASEHVLRLYAGDRLASLLCIHDRASATALAAELLAASGKPAQICFGAFAQTPAPRGA
jgi:HD-like signal output (HDOD) protein